MANNYTLGQDRDLVGFDTAGEARELALSMVSQGRRSALLFTRRLDPPLYDNLAFCDALARLLLAFPRSYAQVLVQETEDLASGDHGLLRVAQDLSSFMTIRIVPDEAVDEMQSFLVIDETAYLHRPDPIDYAGAACFNDPGESRRLSHWFKNWWEPGRAMSELRRLHI